MVLQGCLSIRVLDLCLGWRANGNLAKVQPSWGPTGPPWSPAESGGQCWKGDGGGRVVATNSAEVAAEAKATAEADPRGTRPGPPTEPTPSNVLEPSFSVLLDWWFDGCRCCRVYSSRKASSASPRETTKAYPVNFRTGDRCWSITTALPRSERSGCCSQSC